MDSGQASPSTGVAPGRDEEAELAEALAVLEQLAGALFPEGMGDLLRLTWPDRGRGFEQLGDRVSPDDPEAERARTEARLRAAEARYRTLVEQIPAVTFMAVLGEGENEIYVSPHIEAMLGFTQQEWLDNPFLWYRQLHPDDRGLWNQEFARGCRAGGPFRAECRFLARDGHVVWVHGEARLVKDEVGRPLFLQGVAFDITEGKRAQEILVAEAVRTARIEEELAIAERVQTSILPKRMRVEGIEIAAAMRPASEVGGDYYDVLPFPGGAWIAIGDVSGHGLSAGLVMLMVQSAMSAICRTRPGSTPRELLCDLNAVLFDNVKDRLARDDYVTLSLLRFTRDGRVVFAGGHEDIVVWRRRTRRVECIGSRGVWLGLKPDVGDSMFDDTLELEDGDLLVLFTDGVTEAMNAAKEQFTIERLCAALEAVCDEPPERICEHVLGVVGRWTANQADDMTLVVLRFARETGS